MILCGVYPVIREQSRTSRKNTRNMTGMQLFQLFSQYNTDIRALVSVDSWCWPCAHILTVILCKTLAVHWWQDWRLRPMISARFVFLLINIVHNHLSGLDWYICKIWPNTVSIQNQFKYRYPVPDKCLPREIVWNKPKVLPWCCLSGLKKVCHEQKFASLELSGLKAKHLCFRMLNKNIIIGY